MMLMDSNQRREAHMLLVDHSARISTRDFEGILLANWDKVALVAGDRTWRSTTPSTEDATSRAGDYEHPDDYAVSAYIIFKYESSHTCADMERHYHDMDLYPQ